MFHENVLLDLPKCLNKDKDLNTTVDSVDLSTEVSPNLSNVKNSSKNLRSQYVKSHSVTSNTTAIPSNEFLTNLDSRMCLLALEHLITLLSSQSLLALKDVNLSNREKQLIRRELFTELSIFHDFVKKKILTESKEILYRKKYGCVLMKCSNNDDDDEEDDDPIDHSKDKPTTSNLINNPNVKNSMRVHVVRKLHLEHVGITSTPAAPSAKRFIPPEVDLHSKSMKFDDEEQKYSGQSHIKLVEEDFFHILSIIFSTLSHFDD